MAQKDSPIKRQMRRLKRENTLLFRMAQTNADAYARIKMHLEGVLRQEQALANTPEPIDFDQPSIESNEV